MTYSPEVRGRTRRQFVRATALAAGFFTVPGLFADEMARAALRKTALVTEGPFYPEKLPLDSDNDLVIVSESITPAVGEITHVAGRILDARGEPIRNAIVEIWQVDHNAVYPITTPSISLSARWAAPALILTSKAWVVSRPACAVGIVFGRSSR